MGKIFKTVVTVGALLITSANAWADTVYEKVELFQKSTLFTDSFEISDAGVYTATLTDFSFPAPMIVTNMDVTTSTDLLGKLMAPGSFTFDATPGTYYVSFFGKADKASCIKLGQYGIDISQVPVPAAAWLFGSGLIGIAFVARRKA